MRLLLIDNSNTRTKFALGTPTGLDSHLERVPTKDLDPKLITHLSAQFEFDAVVVSSVVPNKAALLREMLAAKPMHFISHQSELPIGIDYPAPEEIGADRLANAVAVHDHSGTPAIVIDFGTAVTFDVVGLPGPAFALKRKARTGLLSRRGDRSRAGLHDHLSSSAHRPAPSNRSRRTKICDRKINC